MSEKADNDHRRQKLLGRESKTAEERISYYGQYIPTVTWHFSCFGYITENDQNLKYQRTQVLAAPAN